MARDKKRDDRFFNCAEQSEHNYVVGLYAIHQRPAVRTLLLNGCADDSILYSTHLEVYELIERMLGYPVPA